MFAMFLAEAFEIFEVSHPIYRNSIQLLANFPYPSPVQIIRTEIQNINLGGVSLYIFRPDTDRYPILIRYFLEIQTPKIHL